MKKTFAFLLAVLLFAVSTSASAFWRDRYYDDYDYNDWPVFTPMYWMEEFIDEFDRDSRYGNRGWGNRGWGNRGWNRGYRGYPYGGYGAPYGGYAPYGYAPYYAPPAPPVAPAQ